MTLYLQIISFVVSFLYGIFLSFLINLNYHFLFGGNPIVKCISNFLFSFDMAMLYFLIMRKINSGRIHPYFYLSIVISFLLTFSKFKIFRHFFRKLVKSVKCKKK